MASSPWRISMFISQTTHDPVRSLTIERGQEVRDELLLAEAPHRGLARDLDPQREHDERHVRRERPDDELAAVRDRRDEPDLEQRRRRPQSAHVLCSRATASFAFRLKKIRDDLFERSVLHFQVHDRQRRQRAPDDVANGRSLDLQDHAVVVERHDPPADGLHVSPRDGALEAEGDALVRANVVHERLERAVVREPPAVDDDDTRAERRHVLHVMAREDDRGPEALVVRANEPPHRRLHRHVEPDRRLVEEEHAGAVKERRRELALHPLAEGELAGRLLQEGRDGEELDELVERPAVLVARNVVDGAIELEGFRRGEVPEELLLLPGHEHDRPEELGLPEARREPRDGHLPGRRVE